MLLSGMLFSFFCPVNCASLQVLEPDAIGNREIIYSTMVIGGPAEANPGLLSAEIIFFICSAAIHAGIVDDVRCGCGILTKQGDRFSFLHLNIMTHRASNSPRASQRGFLLLQYLKNATTRNA